MSLAAAIIRCVLITALALGIVLPKMTAALAELSPHVWVVVICTGTSMETITLGGDGVPISEPELLAEHCVASPNPPGIVANLTVYQELMRDHAHRFSVQERAVAHALTAHPPNPRGPPILL